MNNERINQILLHKNASGFQTGSKKERTVIDSSSVFSTCFRRYMSEGEEGSHGTEEWERMRLTYSRDLWRGRGVNRWCMLLCKCGCMHRGVLTRNDS